MSAYGACSRTVQGKGCVRCARCGGNHAYRKCSETDKVKCCNCGGVHSAAFQGCIVQKQAREEQRFKITNQVSYAEAVKKVNEGGVNKEITEKQKESRSQTHGEREFPTLSRAMCNVQESCSHKCTVKK